MDLIGLALQKLSRALLRFPRTNPTRSLDSQYSTIGYDPNGPPTARLLDVALAAVQHARGEDLTEIAGRMTTSPRWPERWPGEHYHLLAGLVSTLRPTVVVEIGTYQGLSALALEKRLPPGGVVHTFDVIPWSEIPGQALRAEDFATGRIVQHLDDLTATDAFERHRALLERAEFLFVDAAKDGRMEQVFLDRFATLRFAHDPIVLFDDVRVWNMLGIWRGITRPKLDLVSFGHWSGTGLIDWNGTVPARPRG